MGCTYNSFYKMITKVIHKSSYFKHQHLDKPLSLFIKFMNNKIRVSPVRCTWGLILYRFLLNMRNKYPRKLTRSNPCRFLNLSITFLTDVNYIG